MTTTTCNFTSTIEKFQKRTEASLCSSLPKPDNKLCEAMRYSVLAGGKRLRPVLLYIAGTSLGSTPEQLDKTACALEFIHTYSLIHDDLPAMDDDDLRRGNPTCHIQFGEATAILAGDALQPLAYETVSHDNNLTPEQKVQIIQVLTEISGAQGLALGQQLDIQQITKSTQELEHLYHLKTGIFFEACLRITLIINNKRDQKLELNLISYARNLGLAFQIHDDILDIESPSEILGKPQGSDQGLDKPTYPNLIGLENSKLKVQELTCKAISQVANQPELIDFAHYLLNRNY